MTIHIPVPPKRIVALGGPVSAAIRAMRAAEPATDYTRIRELRRAIAERIEADIALLDALAGDADFEPNLSGVTVSWPAPHDLEEEHDGREPCEDGEPALGSLGGTAAALGNSQLNWAGGGWDDREAVDEDGGDIQDEPHDGDEREDGDDNGLGDEDGLREQFTSTRYAYQGAV